MAECSWENVSFSCAGVAGGPYIFDRMLVDVVFKVCGVCVLVLGSQRLCRMNAL